MTHDPLCPICVATDGLCDQNCAACQCDLIAKVRKEERDAVVNLVQAIAWDITYFSGVARLESISRAKVIAAIKGDHA